MKYKFIFLFILSLSFLLSSCSKRAPLKPENICSIFNHEQKWLNHVENSRKKWGTPIHVQMAILYQESKFESKAKPKRKKILGLIPGKRKSSAYGFAQALTPTWKQYIKETGNHGADRDNFKDAIDFVGWYTHKTQKVTKISKWDAYNQYLAYHEGQGGFQRGSYKNKQWLINVSKKVERVAKSYATQIKSCK